MSDTTILQAAVVWAGPGRVYAPGMVVFSRRTGEILAVGSDDATGGPNAKGSAIRAAYPDAHTTHYEDCLLMPGLVNAHCHLELGYLRGRLPAGHFVDWVIQLLRQVTEATRSGNFDALTQQAVNAGVAESLAAGVTTIGDITRQSKISRPVLGQAPLRIVSFGEVTGLGLRREGFAERLAAAADTAGGGAGPRLQIGLSPHAPYTVEGSVLAQTVQHALATKMPLAMHLAELSEEAEFLAHLTGRLREAWDTSGRASELLDDQIPLSPGGPIRWARQWGLLEATTSVPVVLAHVNYANDDEIEILAHSRATVVVCPRTRAFFGHAQRHRYRDMLAAGVNVCLGTDSLASNPDLVLLREAAEVRRTDPTLPAETLLEMVTGCGAKALGMESQIGTLDVGKQADFITLPLTAERVTDATAALEYIVSQAPAPRCVWIAGKLVKTIE